MKVKRQLTNFLTFCLLEIAPLVILFLATNKFLGPAIYRINDDAIISWLVSGKEADGLNNLTVHTGYFYGIYLNKVSINFPNNEWHGLSQIILIIIAFAILTSLISKKFVDKVVILSLRIFLFIYFIWYVMRPTFTMTAITLGIVAFILLNFALEENLRIKRILFFLGSILLQIASFSIRPNGYFLSVLLVSGYFLYYLLIKNEKMRNFFLLGLNALILFLSVFLDNSMLEKEVSKSRAWTKYIEFNNSVYAIKTNPSELEFYKLVSKNEMKGVDWNYADALVFQTNSFYDESIFSTEVLETGIAQIEYSLGFSGVLDRGLNAGLIRTLEYLEESKYLIFITFLIFLSIFFLKIDIKRKSFLFLALVLPFFMIFYYLGAASRLPFRVYFPTMVFMSLFVIIVIFISLMKNQKLFKFWIPTLLFLVALNLLFGNESIRNNFLLNNALASDLKSNNEKLTNFDPNGIYIGQIEAFPESASFAYSKTSRENISYLTSGWFTFSPIWYQQLYELNLVNDDPYLALAQQEGVYWVSNKFNAEILNIFMNDRDIFRKNLCKVLDLNSQISVYTFQSETICKN